MYRPFSVGVRWIGCTCTQVQSLSRAQNHRDENAELLSRLSRLSADVFEPLTDGRTNGSGIFIGGAAVGLDLGTRIR
jgi:hypothetical protein